MLTEGLRANSKETITLARLALTGKKCLQTIISQQNENTGLFPASAQDRYFRSEDGGYFNHWFRDSAIIILLINDPVVRNFFQRYLPGFKTEHLDRVTQKWIKGTVRLIGQEAWQTGFNQPVIEEEIIDETGNAKIFTHVKDVNLVPPVRTDLAGNPSKSWPSNQPDSWGFWVQAVGAAIKNSVISQEKLKNPDNIKDLTEKKDIREIQSALKLVSEYITRLKPYEIEAVSMWEHDLCRNPSPLSTVIACREGLKALLPYQEEKDKRETFAIIAKAEEIVKQDFPKEFTLSSGHASKTDLATLVVAAKLPEEDLPAFDPLQMLILMDEELRVGEEGMMRRYKGDKYFQVDGREAVWFMSLPLEATLSFKLAEYYRKKDLPIFSKEWLKRGKKVLSAALDLYDKYGFAPELFLQRADSEGKVTLELPPPGQVNNLLWSNIELVTACAYAARAQAIA